MTWAGATPIGVAILSHVVRIGARASGLAPAARRAILVPAILAPDKRR